MSFGDRMKEARKLNKMSQQELADILGISVNSIANYERGTSFPKEDYLYKIIIQYDYLFCEIRIRSIFFIYMYCFSETKKL